MKLTQYLFVTILLGSVFAFSACKKNGCTDENALNYAEEANENDGTCVYEGSIYFWYDEATSNNLISDGIDSLYFYVANNLERVAATADFFSVTKPNCGEGNSISFRRYLEFDPSETATWSVEDESGTTVFSGNTTFSGGQCKEHELTYP